MERLKTLTTIAWLLTALIAAELGFVAYQIGHPSTLLWASLIMIFITVFCMLRIAMKALSELKNKYKK